MGAMEETYKWALRREFERRGFKKLGIRKLQRIYEEQNEEE